MNDESVDYQNQLKPIATVDASGNVLQRFVYGTRINVPDYIVASDTTFRIISDHLGSVRLVVDSPGLRPQGRQPGAALRVMGPTRPVAIVDGESTA